MDREELETRGWTVVDGISSKSDLMELGRSIGTPVRTPNGELIKEIRRSTTATARPGSQSALYGVGSFPLHTDTVFWPTPVRYVLLRGYGDTRRPTTIMSFSDITRDWNSHLRSSLLASVWRVATGKEMFYCSLTFRSYNISGWRYDSDLMQPANDAAIKVHTVLRKQVHRLDVMGITWTGSAAAVLSNWMILHGRGPQPPDEGIRVVERLYVR